MKRPKRENYPNGIFGDISYNDRLERYTSYLENRLKEREQALSIHEVVSRRELLLDFAEYSENDKTSTAIDECVDNYLDSIKQYLTTAVITSVWK